MRILGLAHTQLLVVLLGRALLVGLLLIRMEVWWLMLDVWQGVLLLQGRLIVDELLLWAMYSHVESLTSLSRLIGNALDSSVKGAWSFLELNC